MMIHRQFNRSLCIGALILASLLSSVFAADSPTSTSKPVIAVTLADGTQKTVPWERNMSLLGVILTCGGFSSWSQPRHSTIIRNGKRTTFDTQQLHRGTAKDPNLLPNDHVEFEKAKHFIF